MNSELNNLNFKKFYLEYYETTVSYILNSVGYNNFFIDYTENATLFNIGTKDSGYIIPVELLLIIGTFCIFLYALCSKHNNFFFAIKGTNQERLQINIRKIIKLSILLYIFAIFYTILSKDINSLMIKLTEKLSYREIANLELPYYIWDDIFQKLWSREEDKRGMIVELVEFFGNSDFIQDCEDYYNSLDCINVEYFSYHTKTSPNYITLVKIIIMVFTVIYYFLLYFSFECEKIFKYEYPVMISFITISLLLLLSVRDFLNFFLLLELQSLSLYILCGMATDTKNSSIEAALKYFIMGSLATGILLLGISLIYGSTGSILIHSYSSYMSGFFNYNSEYLTDHLKDPAGLGFILLCIGILFKLAIAPFHLWSPDVYQGAPNNFVAYMAIIPKIAIIIILVRFIVMLSHFQVFTAFMGTLFMFFGLLSIIFGIAGAFQEAKIRPLIFYSSLVNLGFIIFTLGALSAYTAFHWLDILYCILVYIIIYSISLFILFFIISQLYDEANKTPLEFLTQLSGNFVTNRFISLSFIITLFSLIGVPPLAGFFAKFYLIELLIINNADAFGWLLLIWTAVFSPIYLNIIRVIFFEQTNQKKLKEHSRVVYSIIFILVSILLLLGYFTDAFYAILKLIEWFFKY
jgi:NADH-quinone oxidoreductase subunit N